MARADFTLQYADQGVAFFSHPAERFKTTRVDLFLSTLLRRGQHTRLALIGRLLERGTRRLPGLQRLNRFLDELYGAGFAVEVEALGDRQVLHLWLEVIAPPFLPGGEDLLARGLGFLGEVLAEPQTRDGGFRPDYLRQEKKALAALIRSLANDKSAYAHRRCLELMCGDDPCGLPAHGDVRDFRGITPRNLYATHRQLLAQGQLCVFLTGHPAPHLEQDLSRALVRWERESAATGLPRKPPPPAGRAQEVFEAHDVGQARLVLGFRTGIALADEQYPALVLLNAMLGGDSQSRLFRHLREEAGLCYQIGTHLEPLGGLFFVEAGIEAAAYPRVREGIDRQLRALGEGAFAEAELALARQVLQRNLWALDDSCEGLARFFHQHQLAGVHPSRPCWDQRLAAVDRGAVAGVAAGLRLDTAFLLHPCRRGGPR
jgi:predicted Zn-dependent peptidase